MRSDACQHGRCHGSGSVVARSTASLRQGRFLVRDPYRQSSESPGCRTTRLQSPHRRTQSIAVQSTCAASSQDRSAGVRGLPLWDRTVQAQPQGASKALPPRSQRESDHVASSAFWRHTQDQRSLLAQEYSTRPLQSLLYICFSSLGRGGA